MRHIHTKLMTGSGNNKGNDVCVGSGSKVKSVTQKAGATKRVQSDPVKPSKKRKLNENLSKVKGIGSHKHPKETDAEKTQKKCGPIIVKKSCAVVKKLKKPDEKIKKLISKSDKKSHTKVLKRCKVTEKVGDNDSPPTLCETFSRITTMVAETVINEKESQRLSESLTAKTKKESENVVSAKGKSEMNTEPNKMKKCMTEIDVKAKTSVKRGDAVKKMKETTSNSKMKKIKSQPKKSKITPKKSIEKPTLDNIENFVKVLKDEEVVLAFAKGIGTRRKSTSGPLENEQKPESFDSGKVKGEPISKCDVTKKAAATATKVVIKKVAKKEKAKIKPSSESQTKKSSEDIKKTSEKGKDEEKTNSKEMPQKKVIIKKDSTKVKAFSKLKTARPTPTSKNKVLSKEVKSPKPKLGFETDGSNSDELTLNIIQKKTKKTKAERERPESSAKVLASDQSSEDIKINSDEKVTESEKLVSKSKKSRTSKKEDKGEFPVNKKALEIPKEKKKAKETESDTDDDLELKRIMAKKLGRNAKALTEIKKKKPESGKAQSQESDQRAKRLKLFGFWGGPKKHRVASLNAIAKVHCLYENESKGVLAEIEKMAQVLKSDEKKSERKDDKTYKLERKNVPGDKSKRLENEAKDDLPISKRILRGTPGSRSAGKHWDMFTGDSTSSVSSDESQSDTDRPKERKLSLQPSYRQKMLNKDDIEKEEGAKAPKRRRNNEIGVTMDLKDMVVRKRMASLNASAILAASYSCEKRSNRKDSSGTSTDDGLSSTEENDRLVTEEGGNASSANKKHIETEKPEEKVKEEAECMEYRHKKHFWKTKVESLKKSKDKRNSPSPILADFGVEKDLSATVLEKEKNDELNDDKDKLVYPQKKFLEGKLKGKHVDGKFSNAKGVKEAMSERDDKRKYSKRKLCEEDMRNINFEKPDEYEYKSDSDNGQRKLIELRNTGGSNKKVAVIVNQDTDVTITGVYVNSTRSTHEGFCSIAGMQYRISSTSHTQTEATAVLKTSTASEQTPPPSEPKNCTSPRIHKSYTPLSALSSMQPPAGAPSHPHLPPPPHHHHHRCGMGQHRPPPDHYLGHGPISHQRPISPLGRRHGCSSAFSAPHCSSHPAHGEHLSPSSDADSFGSPLPSHGYFQPAGPLIHHPSVNSTSIKSQNLTNSESASTSESQAPPSTSEEPAESTAARSADTSGPPPAAHHMGYPRGYPSYQGGYYQGSYYPPPPQAAHYQPPPPSFHQHYHHHQDLCYPPGYPPSTYPPPPPPPPSYRRFLQPPPSYYSPELTYGSSGPPPTQDHGAQQIVVPGGASSSYSAPLDPYAPPAPYYPGYSPGPGPTCYSHPSRNLAFIEQTYQSCPCPMQLCPKNVHIGPLTGECKRPGALPLPPVALQLPQEPPGAAGPPSPARGSAGMPPQPSPLSNSARPNWEGRNVKSTAEIKWEESYTTLELKPTKYNSEILHCLDNKEKILSPLEKINGKPVIEHKNQLADAKGEEQANFAAQGLLVISSKEMLHTTTRIPAELAEVNSKLDANRKLIKSEALSAEEEKSIKKNDSLTLILNSNAEEFEKSPKRNLTEKLEEIILRKGNKKRKRKMEVANENMGKKMRKMQKQKDENACGGAKIKRNQKNTNSKATLLKDRNETVDWKGNLVASGNAEKKDKSEQNIQHLEAEKIVLRRKSNQDRSGTFSESEVRSVRKSKSCSPIRSKIPDHSPIRLFKDDIKRKQDGIKGLKLRAADAKSKELHEHSTKAAKRKSGANGVPKPGKQVNVQSKSSKSKCKKSASTKSDCSGVAGAKVASKKATSVSVRTGIAPKWSNGWSWDSESFDAKVYLTNDEPPVMRKCYTAMRHVEGDVIHPKDCILLKAGPRRIDLPFVAKVAALWENPDDGEMMVSLLWYYRPEHTDQGRQPSDQQDEIFASRHKDINSVACIEDKCFVLTYNEYCRYRKKVKRVEEGIAENNLQVPRLEQPYFRFQRQPPCVMAPDMVFFCRRVYDFRQRRLLKNPT